MRKWGKILLFVLVFICIDFSVLVIFWLSTWKTYINKDLGFTLKVPPGWDIKNPSRDDINDAQYVFDYGSVVKLGDEDTNFSRESDGIHFYKGNVLVYIYTGKISQEFPKDEKYKKIPGGNITNVYIEKGSNYYEFSISIFNKNNIYSNFFYKFLAQMVVNSFE